MNFKDFNLDKNANGLLPVIVQDATTLKVLMLGYMNEEAYEKTRAEGLVTFWSRSRRCLWTKGETSGNTLAVRAMYPDCDADTLLVQAVPAGPTCHRGTAACFDTPDAQGFVRSLDALVRERHRTLPDGSYTSRLFVKGVKAIAKKVGEESAEALIEAVDGNRDRFLYESGDLLYHYLILLSQMGVSLDELEEELAARHK